MVNGVKSDFENNGEREDSTESEISDESMPSLLLLHPGGLLKWVSGYGGV